MKDSNPVARVGERVFYYSGNVPPRAAIVANVDSPRSPADLVVFCQGRSEESRETWARGHAVVGFRGLVPHVSESEERGTTMFWSHLEDEVKPSERRR